jgi:hypothetical protein
MASFNRKGKGLKFSFLDQNQHPTTMISSHYDRRKGLINFYKLSKIISILDFFSFTHMNLEVFTCFHKPPGEGRDLSL